MATPAQVAEYREEPRAPAQIYLQPLAPPSILGLYGFAGATFMVAAHMAGWFGNSTTDMYLAPFAAMFGGVAQFSAGMWSIKARDGIASAMHGMWGAFWIAFGMLQLAYMHGTLPVSADGTQALGYWFIVLAAITWVGAVAASAENKALFAVLLTLAAGSTIAAIYDLTGVLWLNVLAGYVFLISAVVAWYTASALMLEGAFKHPVLNVGKTERVRQEPLIMPGRGEPGVIRGQ